MNHALLILALALPVACGFEGVRPTPLGLRRLAPRGHRRARTWGDSFGTWRSSTPLTTSAPCPTGSSTRHSATTRPGSRSPSEAEPESWSRAWNLGVQPANVVLRATLRATMPEGTYRWSVDAIDAKGNPQSSTGSNRLVGK